MRTLAWLVVLAACKQSGDAVMNDASPELDVGEKDCEQQMAAALDAAATNAQITSDPNFTVMLETFDGRVFVQSHGTSTAKTRYESASTSKWVTAVVLLDLVERGVLSLDTKAGDVMPPYWTESAIDLRDLLSFTSGFGVEPPCLNLPGAAFATCVRAIYDANVGAAAAPGSEYEYGPTHLQIAGAMASAKTNMTWAQLFGAWKAKHALFATAVYDIPSATNPRIASGMHWTGEEYMGFLRKLARGELLNATSMMELHGNQRGTATVKYSPIWDEVGEDWSYGFGNWIECPTATTHGGFACQGLHRNSSAGAYGAYPFIDFDHEYFGLVARRGDLMSADEGIAIARAIDDVARRWAAGCN